jgi:hypothetical protein
MGLEIPQIRTRTAHDPDSRQYRFVPSISCQPTSSILLGWFSGICGSS